MVQAPQRLAGPRIPQWKVAIERAQEMSWTGRLRYSEGKQDAALLFIFLTGQNTVPYSAQINWLGRSAVIKLQLMLGAELVLKITY